MIERHDGTKISRTINLIYVATPIQTDIPRRFGDFFSGILELRITGSLPPLYFCRGCWVSERLLRTHNGLSEAMRAFWPKSIGLRFGRPGTKHRQPPKSSVPNSYPTTRHS